MERNTATDLYKASLSKGDVFLGDFDGIDHKKLFVIAGLSNDKVYICTVFVNSSIPNFILKKQELLDLQVHIKGIKYNFLKHDSFVSCNTQLKITFSDIYDWINNKKCKFMGRLDEEDLSHIITTIIHSGLLTSNEIDLYFMPDKIPDK